MTEKPKMRSLSVRINSDKFEEREGGLLIKGVKMLGKGVWTDSNIGTPLNYSLKVLKEYAGNWKEHTMWSRHSGFVPHNITDKIGNVENTRFEKSAVMADIFLHCITQESKDTAALVKAGIANYVSVEHGGEEHYDHKKDQYECDTIDFYGAAIVNRGACSVCTLNEEDPTKAGTSNLSAQEAGYMTEVEELTKQLSEMETSVKEMHEASEATIKELSAKMEDLVKTIADKDAVINELSESVKKLSEVKDPNDELKELSDKMTKGAEDIEARIKKLEAIPDPKTGVSGTHNLEASEVSYDRLVFDSEGITIRSD